MKRVLVGFIRMYQKFLSPDQGIFSVYRKQTCAFFPTCSAYTIQAIDKYGAFKGIFLGIKRIIRCHPWQKKHVDPLP